MALISVRNKIHFSASTLPNFNSTLSIAPSMLSQNYRSNLIMLAAEATRCRARKNSAEPGKASSVTQLRIRNCKLEIEFTIFFNFQLSKNCQLLVVNCQLKKAASASENGYRSQTLTQTTQK